MNGYGKDLGFRVQVEDRRHEGAASDNPEGVVLNRLKFGEVSVGEGRVPGGGSVF